MTTEFQKHISMIFGKDTLKKVQATFKQLDMPEPKEETEYLSGTEGILIFSNKHAVTIKIERVKSILDGERISHENILQPIFQKKTGNLIVEIYPGVNLEDVSNNDVESLKDQLDNENINYWDSNIRNTGRIPRFTTQFPKGVPVVIDRLAVAALQTAKSIKKALKKSFYEDPSQKETAQYKLYSPLYHAFKKILTSEDLNNDAACKAWQLCAEFKENGDTIAGWMSDDPTVEDEHPTGDFFTLGVRDVSVNYTKRLKSAKI